MHSPRVVSCLFAAAFGLAVILSLSFVCGAQTESATISGRITDSSGAVIVKATVNLQSADKGTIVQTITNDAGIYVFPSVHPGVYHITVRKDGFKTEDFVGLTANVQDHLEQNFRLVPGAIFESITVTADRRNVNTQDATVSTVVDQQFVENMPLNGRSFQSLINLAPGVVITASGADNPGQFSTNGQRTNANYFTIDGVSANLGSAAPPGYVSAGQTFAGTTPAFTSGGGTNGLVSVDAMQEFRIQTSTYAPEFGRSPGAQISIVTKGGSNQWRGTASDYLRNDIFDARNWFDNPPLPKPPLRQNDFGGTLGGPIWKSHTFFFFSYEGLRLLQPQTAEGYFLTSDAKLAITGPWKPIVNAWPTGTGALLDPTCDNVTNPCQRDLKIAYSDPSSFDAYSLRLDHKLTGKITMFARYNHAPSTQGSRQFQYVQNTVMNTETATVGVTGMVSPTMMNDFRGNWSRQAANSNAVLQTVYGAVVPPMATLFPAGLNPGNAQVGYANYLYTGYGAEAGALNAETQRQLNFVDTVFKTMGFHQLKFGVDFRRMNPTVRSATSLGINAYSWDAIFNGYVDVVLNMTSDKITAHMDNWSLFGQDTWKATPRLTLTYGLRWEINTPPVSDTAGKPLYAVAGIFDSDTLGIVNKSLWSTQPNALAPRVGAAYQVSPKTILRGGFGLFYDLGYGGGVGATMGGAFPYTRQEIFFATPLDLTRPEYQPVAFTTTIGANTIGLAAVDPNLRLPVTFQWNAAVERELGSKQSITATYVGANGQNLLHQDQIIPPGSVLQFTGAYVSATRNAGISHYNALQLQFMRRMSQGFQALVSYSFAKSSDLASNDVYGITFGSISTVKLPPLTPSDFDIRHSFSAAVSYEVHNPAWGGRSGKAVFGGWALDGIYRFQSGPPLDVQMTIKDPVLGYVNVRPLRTGEPIWIPDPTQPAGKALNPAAFALAANGSSDDALRNSISNPYGINQTDLALRRRIKITEKVKLDFRAEYFNLFNHPMFRSPSPSWGVCQGNTPPSCQFANPFFGKVPPGGTLNNSLGGGGASGGQSALYVVGGQRSGQFTLKLSF